MGGKAQSAIEYLMTYGWALLIIAIVLLALFKFGFFSNSITPTAKPGSCLVTRPYGPGTTIGISLTGSCTAEWPQFVASFSGAPPSNSYVGIPTANTISFNGPVTISFWAYINKLGATQQNFIYKVGDYQVFIGSAGAVSFGQGSSQRAYSTASAEAVPVGSWFNIIATFNAPGGSAFSGNSQIYVNGTALATGWSGSWLPSNTITQLGIGGCGTCASGGNFISGYIADVQIYSIGLNANQAEALYLEGIGGAPIYLNYLTGWWPLNGDVNDYSGNNNNGQAYNVVYSSTWENGYRMP